MLNYGELGAKDLARVYDHPFISYVDSLSSDVLHSFDIERQEKWIILGEFPYTLRLRAKDSVLVMMANAKVLSEGPRIYFQPATPSLFVDYQLSEQGMITALKAGFDQWQRYAKGPATIYVAEKKEANIEVEFWGASDGFISAAGSIEVLEAEGDFQPRDGGPLGQYLDISKKTIKIHIMPLKDQFPARFAKFFTPLMYRELAPWFFQIVAIHELSHLTAFSGEVSMETELSSGHSSNPKSMVSDGIFFEGGEISPESNATPSSSFNEIIVRDGERTFFMRHNVAPPEKNPTGKFIALLRYTFEKLGLLY